MSNALAIVTGAIQEARDDFSRVLVDRSISFERESGFAIQQLQKNEFTLKVAMQSRQSVINAVTNIAAIGISLNPARKQAYLIPRKVNGQMEICLDLSYIGLLDLAVASGSILWGQAEIVRENDGFTLNGFDKAPTHVFNPFGKDRGDIVGTYVVVKTHSGDYLTTAMSIEDVHSIRDRSEAWKAYLQKKVSTCPWLTDEGEMIKKTVIKRAYKLWPKTDRLDDAMTHLNGENAEGLAQDHPDDWIDVAPMIAEALRTKTDADALNYWKAHNGQLANQPADHKKLKEAIAAHRAQLRAAAEAARTVDVEARPVVEPSPVMSSEDADYQRTAGASE
jgi:recombination protein RecT